MFRSTRAALIAILAFALCGKMESITRAGDPQPFTEEAAARGINYIPTQPQGFGQGLAFVDLDGDTDPDVILLGRADGVVGIYENDGTGYFIDRSSTSAIPPLLNSSGVVAADYDRDGKPDLYVTRWGDANLLLHNEGGFVFSDTTATAGVGDTGQGAGCGWGDYDLDGFLDLTVANYGQPNRLYHNLGNGTFEDVAVAQGVDRGDDLTFQCTFFDFDRDQDLDLYYATDKGITCDLTGRRNHLYENVGGSFVDITDASGTEACLDAMCIAVGDFNNDLFQDIYVTNVESGNALLMNEGDGTFLREEAAAHVESFAVGWGAVFFDYDNDGIMDLYVCNMFDDNRLYRHEGGWPCRDISGNVAVNAAGTSFTVASADMDDDGDLDLLVMNLDEPIRLFVNHEGELRRWAKFEIVGQGVNGNAIGATVEVSAAGAWQLREVIAGSNYKSQNELLAHFGLNDALIMEEVVVTWPGGDGRSLSNHQTNRTWRIYPPERLGDSDANGIVEFADIDDFIAVVLGQDTDSDHIALSDMNGDTLLDGRDVGLFTEALLP